MAPPHRRLHRNRTPRIAAAGGPVLLALPAVLAAVLFAAPAGATPKAKTPPGQSGDHGRSAPSPAATATPSTPAAVAAALPPGQAPTGAELREARQRVIAEHKALQAQKIREHQEANERAAEERHQLAQARSAEGRARRERANVEIAQRKIAHQEAVVAQRAAVQAAKARQRERAGRGSGGSSAAGGSPPSASAASAPSHATPAPVFAPPAPAPAPVAAAPQPAATPAPAPAAKAATHPRHPPAHRRGDAARRTAAPAGPRAAVASPPALPRPAAATTRRRVSTRARRPAPQHSAPQGPAAIVNTVTKFINVVPPLLRVLIGVLAALAIAFALVSRVAAMRARRLARQRRQLLEDVGLLQAALLPELPERIGPVGTSAAYRPASGPAAGGDFFDVFALADGRLAVIVGDVSGHGRHALPHTTLVRFTLRTYLEAGAQPAEALQAAAPALERQLDESFATVAVATYEPGRRLLLYSCAGHPAPLIIGSETTQHLSACSAPPIGIGEPTGTRDTAVRVPGEAVICFYTDGVVEARRRGALYGQERLAAAVESLGPDATATELLERVASECDHHPDDMAACLLHISGSAAGPVLERERLELDRAEASRSRARRLLIATGLSEASADSALASARALLREHARVVLEVGDMDSMPNVHVWPQNLSRLPAAGMRPRGAVEGGR